MKLSIVIVNYNVRYFLEQTLRSVYSSNCDFEYEVFVVDNDSSDDSLEMLADRFPETQVYALKENLGFSKGNNYAIRKARGEYVLLLNPDTILREDSLQKSVDYMDANDNCGGLGIRMIDGSGTYLKESKRGIPTPLTSFFKMTGIASLFPKSRFFNAYYMGHLPENESNEVEILAGAYMMLRKSVLDEIGLLDEDFFMYGEDIDLSYRILQAGYHNYYLADSEIIHFKGESTRKATFNYVKLFHKAMIQFAQKHFNKLGGIYTIFLRLGIYLKALSSLVAGWFSRFIMPILDFVVLWLLGLGITKLWERFYYGIDNYYTEAFTARILPLSVLVLILIMYLFGVYDKPVRLRKLLSGLSVGVMGVLAFYGLLGEDLRSSRAIITILAISSLFILPLFRALEHYIRHGQFAVELRTTLRYIIVGRTEMIQPVQEILSNQNRKHIYVGSVNDTDAPDDKLGKVKDIQEIVRAHGINEIFFCTGDISRGDIIGIMAELGPEARYRIVEDYDFNILGSDSKDSQGKLYTRKVQYKIATAENRRAKRLFDFFISLVFIILLSLTFFLFKKPGRYIVNLFLVLLGKKSWIGYSSMENKLPHLKSGVLTTLNVYENALISDALAADQLYAGDYSLWLDLTTIVRSFRRLDR